MVDPITVIAIVSGISALFVSIFTHIKHSKCFCVDIETTAGESDAPPRIIEVIEHETYERGRTFPL